MDIYICMLMLIKKREHLFMLFFLVSYFEQGNSRFVAEIGRRVVCLGKICDS